VAGGVGTRLGFDGPKGDYPVSPVSGKTLFRIFAESIAAASATYGAACPWYVMTSPLNDRATREVFEANDYYGLDRRQVSIFVQGTLPAFDLQGRIMLADMDRIACSPDGHGGSLKALYRSGALEDMKRRGVELISYFQVDNPLVNIFDPLFIGLHAIEGSEMSSKALEKAGPDEKVGNFCVVDGRINVIEYSDMPGELADRRNEDGSLVFGLASIAIHILNTAFVERLNGADVSLPFHRAVKKIGYVDAAGEIVEPAEPNGIRLESFVFDALPLAGNSIILRTVRSEEFAPVKNADGPDSPGVAKGMMVERAASWLESAGVKVPRKADGSVDCLIEIAPGFALDRGQLASKVARVPPIGPGDRVYLE
jgi:UDP-N-acetylglucosamine/UDP-N-acetylgalactosamine diphosphorylase